MSRLTGGPPGLGVQYPSSGIPGLPGLLPSQPVPPATFSPQGLGPISSGPSNGLVPGLGLGGFGASTSNYIGGQELGFSANQTIPHHYVTQPSQNNPDDTAWASSLGIGMLVFARQLNAKTGDKSSAAPLPHLARYDGGLSTHLDSSTTMFLEWTQLAEWLVKHGRHFKRPEDVAAQWKLAGSN